MTTTVLYNTVSTELQVVNKMLAAVDIAAITSITGSVGLEVSTAIDRFSEINRSFQTIGWSFNTRLKIKYLRDVNNEVIIPDNVLSASPTSNSRWRGLTHREGKIYDVPNDTYALIDDVWLNIVELLMFEDLPQAARDYIAARAVREHERYEAADNTKESIAGEGELRAWATLINDHSTANEETIEDNINVFSSVFGRE